MKTQIFNFFRQLFKIRRNEKWLRGKIKENPNHSFFPKLVPNNYQYKPKTYRKFLYKNAVTLKVDISDYVGHYVYFGFPDPGQTLLFNLVKEGDTVLDIGTNIGSTLLVMASKIKPNGFVYGFEPDPHNYQSCLKNLALNQFSNLSVDQLGLGEEKGSFELVVDTESNRGGNRISFNNLDKQSTSIKVNTLDNWILENKVTQLDVVKIDVEGFEYKVLKGGEKAIKEHLPTFFIELDDTNLKAVGDSAAALVSLLESWGYQIKHSVTQEKISSKNDFSNCHFDIIAKSK